MRQRGRPRHDDILTPREWEVLDLLRRNLTNEQIAERLGVTHDTAKFHVSEILSKLGVGSRREAAEWQPATVPRRSFAGLAPLLGLWKRLTAAVATKTIAIVVLALRCSSRCFWEWL
jgi:DNA-binding CsgD family transcriptional regulator